MTRTPDDWPTRPKAVLNVGGNNKNIPIPDYYAGWRHDLLDVDPACKPDICLDARRMATLDAGGYDAVYCSHNLEHFFAHEVALVLAGFAHALADDGFAEIRVPNLEYIFRHMVENEMDIDAVLYTSPAGPITIRDTIYGFAQRIERTGCDFYQHKTGFTPASLRKAVFAAGFHTVIQQDHSPLDIRVFAFRQEPAEAQKQHLGLAQ